MEGGYQVAVALAEFLSGRKSLSSLREDLARLTWNVAAGDSNLDRELVGQIDLCLAEYQAGHLTFEELKAELAPIVPTVYFVDPAVEDIKTGSAVELAYYPQWSRLEGIQPSVEPVSTAYQPI